MGSYSYAPAVPEWTLYVQLVWVLANELCMYNQYTYLNVCKCMYFQYFSVRWRSVDAWFQLDQWETCSIEIPYHYGKVWICMYPCGPRIQSSKSILSSSPTLFVEFVVSVYPLDGNSQDWHLHGSRTATGTNCTVHVLHVLVPRGTVPVRNSSIVPVRNSSPDNSTSIALA